MKFTKAQRKRWTLYGVVGLIVVMALAGLVWGGDTP